MPGLEQQRRLDDRRGAAAARARGGLGAEGERPARRRAARAAARATRARPASANACRATAARSTTPPGATSAPQRATTASRTSGRGVELVDDGVGRERRRAEPRERRQRGRLPRAQPAGQADERDAGAARRQAGSSAVGARRGRSAAGGLGVGLGGGSASPAASSAAGSRARRRSSAARRARPRRRAHRGLRGRARGLGGGLASASAAARPRRLGGASSCEVGDDVGRAASSAAGERRRRSGRASGTSSRSPAPGARSRASLGASAAGRIWPSTRLTDSDRRRRSESISRIFTRISSPGLDDLARVLDVVRASSEMCTRPSTPSRISTNAPNVTTFVTLPLELVADVVGVDDPLPRVLLGLLETQRDALAVAVDVEHLDLRRCRRC